MPGDQFTPAIRRRPFMLGFQANPISMTQGTPSTISISRTYLKLSISQPAAAK
jgi:hypothetical protein